MQKIKFLWLREDFRLNDNPAYQAISNSDEKFQIFYSFDEKKFKERSAQRWWLYETLQKLEKQLKINETLVTAFTKLLVSGNAIITDYVLALNNSITIHNTIAQNNINRLLLINEFNYWNTNEK